MSFYLTLVFAVIGAVGASITASFTIYSWWIYRSKAKTLMAIEEHAKKSKAGQISGQVRTQKKIDKMLGAGLLDALNSSTWILKKIPWLEGTIEELEANPDRVLPTLNTLMRSPLVPKKWKAKIQATLNALLGTEDDGEPLLEESELEEYL